MTPELQHDPGADIADLAPHCVGLTEADLHLSPTFIDFVVRWLSGARFEEQRWPNQLSEELWNPLPRMEAAAEFRLQRLLLDPEGQSIIDRVYEWFVSLATGRMDDLKALHGRYHFIAIVGIPRTGGSYLTSEIFRALDYESRQVPAAVAHDGFPNARPFSLYEQENSWIDGLMSISEYLVTLELFFARDCRESRIIVPKKVTKAIYSSGLFKCVFGPRAEYLVTVRHPIACCISTYEKSGGLPTDGKMKVRSAIERWIGRDLHETGVRFADLPTMDYFDAYVRYWEQFYITLALSGMLARRDYSVIPYGKEAMEQTAQRFHARYNSKEKPAEFMVSPGLRARHPDWVVRAQKAVARVTDVWNLVGLEFPQAALEAVS